MMNSMRSVQCSSYAGNNLFLIHPVLGSMLLTNVFLSLNAYLFIVKFECLLIHEKKKKNKDLKDFGLNFLANLIA